MRSITSRPAAGVKCDESLNHREVEHPRTPNAQAVDDRLAVDRLQMAGRDAALHRRTVRRLDADHARVGVMALDGHRHPRDKPAATDGDDHRVDLPPVLHNL